MYICVYVYMCICIYVYTHTLHTLHTLHYIALHYVTLHYTTLHYITLHYFTLLYFTLRFKFTFTLHYIHTSTSCLYIYTPKYGVKLISATKVRLDGLWCIIGFTTLPSTWWSFTICTIPPLDDSSPCLLFPAVFTGSWWHVSWFLCRVLMAEESIPLLKARYETKSEP